MSRAAEIRDAVVDLVQPLLVLEGLVLVECSVALSRGSLKLDLAVDRDGAPADGVHGLNVGEYARLTRYLSNVLEAEMPELGELQMIVGSPGMVRRLESELELAWGVGKEVEVRFRRGGEKLVGRLSAYDSGSVTLEIAGADSTRIERVEIASIRLHFAFPEPSGRRGRKR
jgi:ribosome maturation factor RimP